MKASSFYIGAALIASSMFSLPALSNAATLQIQTLGNNSSALAGTSGATIAASALISVVVTDASTGAPITNLGTSVGSGTGAIALPSGWTLFTNLNVPPGGCLLTPTQFYNWGNGAYNVRVVPFATNASCKWLLGDYHYVLSYAAGTTNGSGLGKITIAK